MVAGYVRPRTVTHISTNRARRRVTLLTCVMPLVPLGQTSNRHYGKMLILTIILALTLTLILTLTLLLILTLTLILMFQYFSGYYGYFGIAPSRG